MTSQVYVFTSYDPTTTHVGDLASRFYNSSDTTCELRRSADNPPRRDGATKLLPIDRRLCPHCDQMLSTRYSCRQSQWTDTSPPSEETQFWQEHFTRWAHKAPQNTSRKRGIWRETPTTLWCAISMALQHIRYHTTGIVTINMSLVTPPRIGVYFVYA